MKLTKALNDPRGNVCKLIFEAPEAIAETVLYTSPHRVAVCFSVQSGCPVGCSFCGTGKLFLRDFDTIEIIQQVVEALEIAGGPREKTQFMAMSMGEPMLNWDNLECAFRSLGRDFPSAQLLMSTVGIADSRVWNRMIEAGKDIGLGIQISLHHWDEERRFRMLGNYPKLASFPYLQEYASEFKRVTGRPVYWNYICRGGETQEDAHRVVALTLGHHVTCSVLCNTSEPVKVSSDPAIAFSRMLVTERGVDVSIFDPAGQDTVGGGCGQLLYVQQRMREVQP